ncbi:MAG: DUF4282 domain-containing protein [Litorimonas sp.]
MKNLINFFFSFDKLMKEKLVLPFFWLAVISLGLFFSETALDAISLGPLAAIVNFFEFFVAILLAIVFVRLMCELAVAIFRINDNLSPDGGKSETANIDPMAEARKVAEAAAERAREVTKTAGEKTQAATRSARDSMNTRKTQSSASSKSAANDLKSKTTASVKATPSRKTAPKNPAAKKSSTKPASSTKTTTSKTTVKKRPSSPTGTAKKRGPKAGVKVQRDAQGRLLKKDGTLRAKPGPKT